MTAFEPPTKFAFNVKDDTSEHDHTYMFTPQGDGTLVERTALGKWSFGMWLLASTMGGIMIGKPAAKKADAADDKAAEKAPAKKAAAPKAEAADKPAAKKAAPKKAAATKKPAAKKADTKDSGDA